MIEAVRRLTSAAPAAQQAFANHRSSSKLTGRDMKTDTLPWFTVFSNLQLEGIWKVACAFPSNIAETGIIWVESLTQNFRSCQFAKRLGPLFAIKVCTKKGTCRSRRDLPIGYATGTCQTSRTHTNVGNFLSRTLPLMAFIIKSGGWFRPNSQIPIHNLLRKSRLFKVAAGCW